MPLESSSDDETVLLESAANEQQQSINVEWMYGSIKTQYGLLLSSFVGRYAVFISTPPHEIIINNH